MSVPEPTVRWYLYNRGSEITGCSTVHPAARSWPSSLAEVAWFLSLTNQLYSQRSKHQSRANHACGQGLAHASLAVALTYRRRALATHQHAVYNNEFHSGCPLPPYEWIRAKCARFLRV